MLKMKSKRLTNSIGSRELGLILFIILISIIIDIRNPIFLTFSNIGDMLTDTSILAILAVGMMLVIITGGIDLSIGSGIALTGMIVGLTVARYKNISPALAILMGTVIGTGLGALTGLIVSRGKVLPIIATLGMMNIYRGITFLISGGQWVDAYEMPESFKNISRSSFLGINSLVIFAVIIYIIAYYFVNYTRTGRQIYAVGSNKYAAEISGIPINKITWLVYTIQGALYGLGGVLWVSRYASAQNDSAQGFEMMVIAACVLGGTNINGGSGTIFGLILGSLIIGIINNALPLVKISPFWQTALQGLIILAAVILNAAIAKNREKQHLMRGEE